MWNFSWAKAPPWATWVTRTMTQAGRRPQKQVHPVSGNSELAPLIPMVNKKMVKHPFLSTSYYMGTIPTQHEHIHNLPFPYSIFQIENCWQKGISLFINVDMITNPGIEPAAWLELAQSSLPNFITSGMLLEFADHIYNPNHPGW